MYYPNENFSDLYPQDVEGILLQDGYVNNAIQVLGQNNMPDLFEKIMPIAYPLPLSTLEYICSDELNGPYDFAVSITSINEAKNPWKYSILLNKLFTKMSMDFPVDFSFGNYPPAKQLYIRTTPAFSLPADSRRPVYRCMLHESSKDPSNKDVTDHVRFHLIRSCNSNGVYVGTKENNEHLSVIVPLIYSTDRNNVTKNIREMYNLQCMTSCPGGMDRHPIQLIFQLEDEMGEVYGRRVMNVRICSSPKRDKAKEEEAKLKESGRGKKRRIKTESTDSLTYNINLKIIGKSNYETVVKFARDVMLGEHYTRGERTDCPYRTCAETISALIDDN